jgi:tetratricopeptide (TPR) repeat protein
MKPFFTFIILFWASTLTAQHPFEQVLNAMNEDDYDQALTLLDELKEEPEQAARAYALAGEIYVEIGEIREAVEEYEKAWELSDDPTDLYNLAYCYSNLDMNGEWRDALQTYVNLVPDDAEATYFLGNAYWNTLNLEKACLYWHKAKELGWTDFSSSQVDNCD